MDVSSWVALFIIIFIIIIVFVVINIPIVIVTGVRGIVSGIR